MTTDRTGRPRADRRRTHRPGAWAAGALAAGLVLGAAPSASAHDRLVGSDPESGAVLEAVPAEAVLTFSSEVQELGTVLELRDAAGEPAGGGATSVEGRDVVLPVPPELEGGDYTVVYRVTSSDGHPISGEVPFTLDVAAAPPAAPSPSTTSGAGPTATAAEPSPSSGGAATSSPTAGGAAADDAEPAASSTQDTGVPWAPVVVVLVVVVLGGLAAAVLGRQRGGARTR